MFLEDNQIILQLVGEFMLTGMTVAIVNILIDACFNGVRNVTSMAPKVGPIQ